MSTHTNQTGFSVVESVIVIAVVVVLGLVGYNVYSRHTGINSSTTASPTSAQQPLSSNVPAAVPTINTTTDLNKAAAELDQTDPSGSNSTDSSQLDAQLAGF